MTKREILIQDYARSLKEAIGQEITLLKNNSKYTTDLALEYTIVSRALVNLLNAMDSIKDSGLPNLYYEYTTISGEGLKLFKKKYGEVVSVLDARQILGTFATETMIRTILHSSDYFVAVKARVKSNNTQMVISKQSVLNLKEKVNTDPLGTSLLAIYKSPQRKEDRAIKKIITLDEELNKELEGYILNY